MRIALLIAAVLSAATAAMAAEHTISGKISVPGKDDSGIFITASDTNGVHFTVVSQKNGSYELRVAAGSYVVRAHQTGFDPATSNVDATKDITLNLSLSATTKLGEKLPASMYLGLLPESPEKRKLIIDCLGCHQLNRSLV